MLELSAAEKALVISYMYARCGIDLKTKEYLVASKIGVECFKRHLTSFQDFWLRLSGQDQEAKELQQVLIDILTTSYSYFYREEDHFKLLTELVATGKLPLHPEGLHGWCAGCAGGQEAYTLTMNLAAAQQEGKLSVPFDVTASDISSKAVSQAQKARYSLSDYVRLPEPWRKAYCFLVPGGCEVRKDIRSHIIFRRENLLQPLITEPYYDFVFCRNVLIYFDKESSSKLLAVLTGALRPGGYLFLGHTEIFNEMPGLEYVHPAVFRKAGAADGI
jgi:chemotaxis protein methyltransferase CheR